MKKASLRIIILLFVVSPKLSDAQCSDLFFSEYMEGSSYNKVLEIYNPTSASIDLSDYLVYRNNNGSITPSATFSPQGILAPDSVFVIVNSSSIPSIISRSDTTSSLTSFNGDDAVWMKKISTGDTLDIIGVIGVDPGSRWTVGSGSTQNTTLVRKVSVLDGQVDWAIGATEWDAFPQNTEDSLGTHTKNPCPSFAAFTVVTSVDASPSCIGSSDGAVTATVTGSGTYTYSWSNAATSASISGLAAGTYTVTVSDGTASVVESITISEPTAIVLSISVDARVSASGASDGALTASATGGTLGYTYLWSNGASTASITGLLTGTYVVTVTDGNSCTEAKSTVLGLDLAKLVITEIMYNPAAFSDSMEFVEIYNNGSSAADMTGYTISQDIGYTFSSVTINAGEYLLIARDSSAISNVLGLTAYQWTTGNLANSGDQLVLKDNVGNTLDSIDYSDASPWPTGTPSPDGDGPSIELMDVNMDNNVASNWTFSPTAIAGVIENGKQAYGTPGAAFVSPSVADLVITEIMYNPAAGTDSMEFIELYNNGLTAVNMNGYSIAPGINYTFPQVIVNSGSFVLVARDSSAMSNVLGITTAREWTSGDNLSNTAEQLVLKDNRGITVDSLDYDDGSPWPTGTPTPDGDGPSIELLNVALDNNVGSNWIASPTAISGVIENGKQVYGSPGALFSYPTLANLIVTEIYYNTPGSDSIEYVEILNATNATVKLDGYSFSNGVSYTFGVTDSILAGGYYITALDSTAFFNVFGFKSNSEWSSGNLVNSSELIKIIDPFGRTVDSVQYDDGGTWPSSPDGGGPSLVLCDSLADNSNGSNWSAATSATGVTISGSAILANPGSKAPCTVLLTVSITIDSNVTCNSFSNGGATVSVTTGNSGYSYAWTTSISSGIFGTTASVNGLTAGKYFVTVSDASGATAVDSVTITEPAALAGATAIDSSVSCNGLSNGGATASVIGGMGTYTYAWSTSTSSTTFATTASITGLAAATYAVTITDANGCTDTETATITEPLVLAASVAIDASVTCNGLSDAGVTASANGGTGVYTYAWSTSTSSATFATTASITGAAAETYTVTITDANGCLDTETVIITEPAVLAGVTAIDSNASCNGLFDGGATASATGGTGVYAYAWSNSGTTASITGIAAATYTVTITDANGCTDIESALITEPATLVAATVIDNNVTVTGGSDGGATGASSGGTAPFTYAWSTSRSSSIFATTASITGLMAGTYTITITDGSGCSDTETATISEPAGPGLSATVRNDSNVSCNGGANGGLTALPTGGTSPYTYLWSDGSTTASVFGLSATSYTVTITDNVSATITASNTITEPTAIMVAINASTNVTCNGLANGSVSLGTTGGTTPYTFLWSNSSTTATVNGLVAGMYSATVTDANGCLDTTAVTITEPVGLISSTIVDSNVTINGGSNGGATVTGTGGTAPYSYTWTTSTSSVILATTSSITGVAAGTYFVTITDANGCNDSSSVTVSQPTALVVAVTVDSNVTCNGFTNGGATSNVSGGTTPYTYLWSNAVTTPSVTGIAAATYTVTITDATGASSTANVSITEPAILVTSLIVDSNVTTNGGTDGGATATATGGTAPYTFVWSTSTSSVTLATTASITGVVAGTYTASVTDANGCVTTSSATITQPAIIGAVASLIISEINYNGPETGLDTSEFIEFVNAGTTTVNLNGYTFPQGVTHTFGPNDSVTAGQYFVVALDSSAFRNRFGFNADAIWTAGGLSNGGEDIIIVDDLGRGIDTVDFDDNTPWPSGGSLAGSPDGGGATIVLCDSLSDNNDGSNWNAATTAVAGQVINMLQVYANPGIGGACISPLITSTTVDSNATCNGLNNGGGTLTVMGGSAPYSYLWSNSVTTASITGLIAGTYTVTVTDNLGTTALDSVVITEPTQITVTFSVTNTTSTSGADGTITSTVAGGIAPYTYLWSNAATTANISNLSTGTYTVTITDANGCSQVGMTTVQGPSAVILVIDLSNVTCFGAADGTAKTRVSGGALPYIYLWSNAATTDSIGALAAGTYSVTVTDNVGVIASDSITIVEPTQIQLSLSVTNASAQGATDGAIDLTVVGGTPGFTYNWSASTSSATIATTEDITLLAAGAYLVTVTDTNGCQDVGSASVSEPGAVANLVITEINYNGPEAGTDTSEFIEFTNVGSSSINLNGYNFSQGVTHTFGVDDSITVGQYFVIAYDSSAFRNRYGFDADAVWNSGGLSNGGEDITLVDNFGRTVDSVDFDDRAPWPANAGQVGPDGNGSSIELQTALTTDNNNGSNWIASALAVPGVMVNGFQVFGSPGNPYTTGINAVNTDKNVINIYPNPTRGMVTIETTADVAQRIQLISMEGKVLRDMRSVNNQTQLDLSELANGVYFLKVGSEIQKVILSK